MTLSLAANVQSHLRRAQEIDGGAYAPDGEAEVHRTLADTLGNAPVGALFQGFLSSWESAARCTQDPRGYFAENGVVLPETISLDGAELGTDPDRLVLHLRCHDWYVRALFDRDGRLGAQACPTPQSQGLGARKAG